MDGKAALCTGSKKPGRNRVRSPSALLPIAALRLALGELPAHETEREPLHHGAHVHGHGVLHVATDVERVHLELRAPAANFLGFEHAPRHQQERVAVTRLQAALEHTHQLVVLDARAQCEALSARVLLPESMALPDPSGRIHAEHAHAETAAQHRSRGTCGGSHLHLARGRARASHR